MAENEQKLNPNKVKKLTDTIIKYLDKYRVGTGADIKYTHISMAETFVGKFNLDKKSIKEFNKLYAEVIDYGIELSIAEKPKDYGPILVDIDLEIPIEDYIEGSRLYNDKLILEVVDAFRLGCRQYLDITDSELQVCLTEKPKPTMKSTIVKDGFHLIFNNTCTYFKTRHLIRQHAISILENIDIFSKFTKSIDTIIDKAVVSTNCWLMYGSRKKDGQVYKLTKILNIDNNEMNLDKFNDKYMLIKMFSLQQKIWSEENANAYLENIDNDIIDLEYKKKFEKNYSTSNIIEDNHIPEDKEDLIRRATYLVSILDDNRVSEFHSWIRVGWALHNIDYSLLSVWIQFSKRSSKYKEGECEEKWKHMRNDGLTIRSLMLWAQQDNYTKYNAFIDSEFSTVLNKSLDGSTYYIGKALYTKYFDRFTCASLKNDLWYEFRNNKWVPVIHGYTLLKEISESFANEYMKLVSKLNLKATQLTGMDREELLQKASRVQKIISQLMNISFKEKVMKECKNLFHDPEFEKKLDENYDLIGFNNGVYDLVNEEFRAGRPDDYISKSTNNDFVTFNKLNPYASKMFKFIQEILPIEAVRKYFLLSLCTCVSGHNKEEKLNIATGSGSNGKSLLFSLVQMALGDYYISCPITIITRKRGSSNQASPELLRLKGARCGCFQETDDGEKLNVGIMKEITGNDSFMVRGLFADPIEIKPQIKFYLACNQLPAVPSTDGGTWRRLRVIGFNSKFVETPVKSNEYLIDNTLKQKMKEWAPIFSSYLIYLYVTEYKKLSYLSEPDEVKYTTNSYKMENDHFTEFFINRIEITNNKKDNISVKTMYESFKEWFKLSHEGCRMPVQNELNKFLNEKIGEPKRNQKWVGYKFIDTNDNNESDSDNEQHEKSALDI